MRRTPKEGSGAAPSALQQIGRKDRQPVRYHSVSMGFFSGLGRGYREFSRQFDEATEAIGGGIGWAIPWSIVVAVTLTVSFAVWRGCHASGSSDVAQSNQGYERPVARRRSSGPGSAQRARKSRASRDVATDQPSPSDKGNSAINTDTGTAPPAFTSPTPVPDTPQAANASAPDVPAATEPDGSSIPSSDQPLQIPYISTELADSKVDRLRVRITSGEDARFPIKYNYRAVDSRRYNALFACCGYSAVSMVDGVISVSKNLVTFEPSGGAQGFSVPLEKIVMLANQPTMSNRIHLRVKVMNPRRNYEETKHYYFYHPRAVGVGPNRGPAAIVCNGCDDSVSQLYELLTALRQN